MASSTTIASTDPDSAASRALKQGAIKVLVVDDSLTVRSILSRMIDGERDLQVIHKTSSAELALQFLRRTPVDVVLLDLEMPGMGGLAALPRILEAREETQVLVVSTLTKEGAEPTLEALSMGAADTMAKPRAGEFDAQYCETLFAKIRALGGSSAAAEKAKRASPPPPVAPIISTVRPRLIAVGASTGGIHAMCQMLQNLPESVQLPILVTQHLPASFMGVFARQLEIASGREAEIARTGTVIEAGRIYVAPGDGHMTVTCQGGDMVVRITSQSVASGCTPSVDPMLSSIARNLDGQALAVVLSGMGRDGAEGAALLRQEGGTILVQDQKSSAVWGMPGTIAKRELASAILPPDELGKRIAGLAGRASWK